MRRKRLGELLLDFGLVNEAQVQQALQNRAPGERVGEALVNQGFVSERALQKALAIHLKVPIVEVAGREIHPAILAIVPAEMAKRLGVLPIARQKKAQGESIYLATADPTNEYAMQEVARHTNLAIEPMLAKPTELREAIERAYQSVALDDAPPIQVQRNDGKIPGFDTPSGGVDAPPAAVVGTLLESGGHVSPPETLLNVPASTIVEPDPIVEPEPLPLESLQPLEQEAAPLDPEPLPLENIQPLVSPKTQAMTSPPSLDAARTLLVPAYTSPEDNPNILVVPGPAAAPEKPVATDPMPQADALETLLVPASEIPAPATMPTPRPNLASIAETVPLKKPTLGAADTLLDTPAVDLGRLPIPEGAAPQSPAMTMGFDRPDNLAEPMMPEPMMPPPAISVDVSSAVVPLAEKASVEADIPSIEAELPIEPLSVEAEPPPAAPDASAQEERTEMLAIAPPCPNCGADTVFQAKFCGQCGSPLNVETPVESAALEPEVETRPPLTVAETDALERKLGATWTTTAAGAADAVEKIAGDSDGLSVLRTVLAPVTLAEATYSDEPWNLIGLPPPTSRHFAPALVNQTNADVAQADEPWQLVQGSPFVESGEMTRDNLSHPWVRKTKISELTLTQLQALTERLFNAGALSQEDLDNAKDMR